jgi:hypothetical protein
MSHAWLRDYGSPYFEYGIGLVHAGYQVKITQKIPQLQGGEIYQPGFGFGSFHEGYDFFKSRCQKGLCL